MLNKIVIAAVSTSALLFAAQASAHSTASEIDQQQYEQSVMIAQGMKTCQLTPDEAKTLKTQAAAIAELESKYRANGLQSWELNTLATKLHTLRVSINTLTKNSTTCSGSTTERDLQPGVIGRSDASRIPRTTDGRGSRDAVYRAVKRSNTGDRFEATFGLPFSFVLSWGRGLGEIFCFAASFVGKDFAKYFSKPP